nr:hypothetical protein [Actinomycetospora cinnamomea]
MPLVVVSMGGMGHTSVIEWSSHIRRRAITLTLATAITSRPGNTVALNCGFVGVVARQARQHAVNTGGLAGNTDQPDAEPSALDAPRPTGAEGTPPLREVVGVDTEQRAQCRGELVILRGFDPALVDGHPADQLAAHLGVRRPVVVVAGVGQALFDEAGEVVRLRARLGRRHLDRRGRGEAAGQVVASPGEDPVQHAGQLVVGNVGLQRRVLVALNGHLEGHLAVARPEGALVGVDLGPVVRRHDQDVARDELDVVLPHEVADEPVAAGPGLHPSHVEPDALVGLLGGRESLAAQLRDLLRVLVELALQQGGGLDLHRGSAEEVLHDPDEGALAVAALADEHGEDVRVGAHLAEQRHAEQAHHVLAHSGVREHLVEEGVEARARRGRVVDHVGAAGEQKVGVGLAELEVEQVDHAVAGRPQPRVCIELLGTHEQRRGALGHRPDVADAAV